MGDRIRRRNSSSSKKPISSVNGKTFPPPLLSQCFLPSGSIFSPFSLEKATSRTVTLLSRVIEALGSSSLGPASILHRLFIPRGALPPDYLTFQSLDCLQGLCSYLRGAIAQHATLTGMGFESGTASTLSAITVLLLKDGSSHLASLAFAFGFSSTLDGEVRFWRLAADVANDVGLTLELLAPLAGPSGFLPLTCLANAFKAVCGVAAGATRVAISSHFAQGVSGAHVAEVTAKEGTQETAVTLAGLLLALYLAPFLNASPSVQWSSFLLLTLVHVLANAAAVRSLALRTLSRTRALLLLDATSGGEEGLPPTPHHLPSPLEMRLVEPLWPVQYLASWWGGRRGGEGGVCVWVLPSKR